MAHRIEFSSGDVNDHETISVESREEAADVLWQRFYRRDNPRNAISLDWGDTNCVFMLDSVGKLWYCRYFEKGI